MYLFNYNYLIILLYSITEHKHFILEVSKYIVQLRTINISEWLSEEKLILKTYLYSSSSLEFFLGWNFLERFLLKQNKHIIYMIFVLGIQCLMLALPIKYLSCICIKYMSCICQKCIDSVKILLNNVVTVTGFQFLIDLPNIWSLTVISFLVCGL